MRYHCDNAELMHKYISGNHNPVPRNVIDYMVILETMARNANVT